MAELSKAEKKELMKKWKAQQNRKFVLSRTRVKKLFAFLDKRLEEESCDETLRFTKEWLAANISPEKKEDALAEMAEMGGYCDCEVLANCYEQYSE